MQKMRRRKGYNLVFFSALLMVLAALLLKQYDSTDERSGLENSVDTVKKGTKADNLALIAEQRQSVDVQQRFVAMQAAYKRLSAKRRALKKRLSLLKQQVWGIEVQQDQATTINTLMLAGFKLLHNPKKLGAFSSVSAIQNEIARVDFADNNLDRVEAILDTY